VVQGGRREGIIVLIALFSDIHANKPAFEACLADAKNFDVGKIVLLGDYVGYGAFPEWTVDKVMELVERGAAAIAGNHDAAVTQKNEQMNPSAQSVIEWTRVQLSMSQQQFLANLPLSIPDGDRLFVHSDASAPARFRYILDVEDAARSINATRAEVSFTGHVHKPAIYSMSVTAKLTSFTPSTGVSVPLMPRRRWLITVGSVGQPRDGDPAAAYCIYDTSKREITFRRVPYDIETAAAAINRNGLPAKFAERLFIGR
jgi:diadenosine tetraphosphatase ApaH/serine/threonine PP2A family protein phosphatase